MFDIGWLELIIIGIVALIVVGPKDLPGLFRTVGRFMGRARGMAREFQRSMEEAADESGMKEAANSIRKVTNPLNDPNRRRIFVSLILGEENGDNLFHWMRVWYPNVPGKNRGYKHVVRYLCLNIEGLRIEELYAIRSNECGTPPFDFLDQ